MKKIISFLLISICLFGKDIYIDNLHISYNNIKNQKENQQIDLIKVNNLTIEQKKLWLNTPMEVHLNTLNENKLKLEFIYIGAIGPELGYIYTFKKEYNKYILISIETYQAGDIDNKATFCKVNMIKKEIYKIKLKETDICYQKDKLIRLKELLALVQNHKVLNLIDTNYLSYILRLYPLTQKTITQYNNIAYYLQKQGENEEAVYLLEKILEKYPNRVVAHYNIADAYWAIGKKDKAIKHYKIYIELMKQKGKEEKIPKEVLNRVPLS